MKIYKAYREKRGYTQRQLAELIGDISQRAISHYERGTRLPPLKRHLRICEVLKVPHGKIWTEYHKAVMKR